MRTDTLRSGMQPFGQLFPDVARDETRTIRVCQSFHGLPSGDYSFIEFYCNDRKCDCRRVLFHVWENSQPDRTLASINYGWEPVRFYTRWQRGETEEEGRESKGPYLDPLNPNGEHAGAILELFEKVLLPDTDFIARLARHYRMVKCKNAARSPLHRRVRTGG